MEAGEIEAEDEQAGKPREDDDMLNDAKLMQSVPNRKQIKAMNCNLQWHLLGRIYRSLLIH